MTKKKTRIVENSGEVEWYTPAKYVAAAREVMGGIDLDPASCKAANEIIAANTYYTKEQDGLSFAWEGRVWLNPPYRKGIINDFVGHFLSSFNIREAVVLVNNATETKWFQKLAPTAEGFCFPSSRIKFISPEGAKNSPLQGQVFLYFGENYPKFKEVFSVFGFCCGADQ